MTAGPAASTAIGEGARLSVGYYCPAWPPDRFANGIITYVEAIASGLRQLGQEARILSRIVDGEGGGRGDGAEVIDLGGMPDISGAALLLDRLARRLRPGSILAQMGGPIHRLRSAADRLAAAGRLDLLEVEESFGLAAGLAGRVPVPVVVRLHGPWFLNGENQGEDPSSPGFEARVRAEGLGIRAASAVTSPSAAVLDRVRSYYGLPLADAEVIPNPVRLVPPDRRWRPESCEPDHVLFVGRFDLTKGGDTIIDAFAELLRDRPGARLTFVGPDKGLGKHGRRWSLPEYVEHRIPGAPADGRIRCLGQRAPAEIAALRPRAAVTVVASRYESFAITATEAMAAGCPLVATRAGGAAELFEHEEHGLYVDPDDPSALAGAISRLLTDRPLAAALGRAAADRCRRHYAPEVVAERSLRSYRRVLDGLPGRRPGIIAGEVRP